MANKFQKKLRGYDVKEVDSFIAATTAAYEERLTRQAEAIDELKAQCATLRAENAAFSERERSVSKALLAASEKAEEIEAAAKVRYSLEIQRLKAFQEKWADYMDKFQGDKAIGADVRQFAEFLTNLEQDLTAVMERDLNMSATVPTVKYQEGLSQKAKGSSHGFDLREALTPKQTLAEICRELGLTE